MIQTPQLSDGNLWLHFTRTSDWRGPEPSVPILDRGQGCYVWDIHQRTMPTQPEGGSAL